MEMLGARASEVAGVLAERRLLGQPWQALDFVLFGSCLPLRRPEQQQLQQERRPLFSSNHLRRKGAGCLLAPWLLSACVQPSLGRSWRRTSEESLGPAPAPTTEPPPLAPTRCRGLRDPLQPPEFPHLCSPASLLSRRCLVTGSHVYVESRVLWYHVTDFHPSLSGA